jgi:hypothetical protein
MSRTLARGNINAAEIAWQVLSKTGLRGDSGEP